MDGYQEKKDYKMPIAYILIGIPCSGKTTWVEKQEFPNDVTYISSDHYIEEHAFVNNTNYKSVFKDYAPIASKLMFDEALEAIGQEVDIVWDQTNTTVSTRRKKLAMLKNYHKIAVVFKQPKPEVLKERLDSRKHWKEIPDEVINDMIEKFQVPTKSEGFDDIWFEN
jgi:predicted kinase